MNWPPALFCATQTFSVLSVVSAGTVKLKPVPSVLRLTPSGGGGGPPLCCRPVRASVSDVVGEVPSDHANVNGCGVHETDAAERDRRCPG